MEASQILKSAEIRGARFVFAARMAMVLIAAMAALLTGELAVRVFYPQLQQTPVRDDLNGVEANRPNVHGMSYLPHTYDVRFSTGPQRFRGSKNYSPWPAPGSARVVVLGDSYTWGVGANDPDTYPETLRRVLSAGLGQPVEVINAGLPGTGTGEQTQYFTGWVQRFHPSLVILTVNENDFADDIDRQLFVFGQDGQLRERPLPQVQRADRTINVLREVVNSVPGVSLLAEHSQLYNLFRQTATRDLHNIRASGPGSGTPKLHDLRLGQRLVNAEIMLLRDRVRADGAELVVTLFPMGPTVYDSSEGRDSEYRDGDTLMRDDLKALCAREGIPFADVVAGLKQRAKADGSPFYFHGLDDHPTPAANHAFAELLGAYLTNDPQLRAHLTSAELHAGK